MAQVVHHLNPFDPLAVEQWAARDGTLWELAPTTALPHVCAVNGEWVLRADWSRKPTAGDHVAFVVLPQGGGGRKNPLRTLALIAIAVVAPQIGAALFGQGTLAASFAALAINAIGSLLLAPKPPSGLGNNELAAPSPTYTLGSQQNQARLGQPIPVVYGRLRTFPDLASQPYTLFNNTTYGQTLYQLLAVTQGECEISDIRIEDTPIENYPDVDYNILNPGDTPTLVAAVINAPEAGGQELLGMVDGAVQWVGPYTVNPARTQVGVIIVDLVQPRGNYKITDGGQEAVELSYEVQLQLLDDEGNAVGGWFTALSGILGGVVTDVRRLTYSATVPLGRYQARVGRTSAKSEDAQTVSDIVLGGIKSQVAGTNIDPNVTYVEIAARATNSLNDQSARRVNCLVERKLPIWTGSAWTDPVVTRSIVWAFCDVLRNSRYGGALPNSRLALSELLALDDIYDDRFELFDGVFDTASTQWEAAQIVARAGFAVAVPVGGQVTMVRDAPQAVASALFSPRNTVKSSLQVEYQLPTEETPQAYKLQYLDNRTWRQAEVIAFVPGAPSMDPELLRVATVNLFGVTDETHAQRHANYLAADATYRRRVVSWDTEMDGVALRYGQQVLLSHDAWDWGAWGEVVAVAGLSYRLSEPVSFGADPCYIRFTAANGSVLGPYLCTAGEDAYTVELDPGDVPPTDPLTGCERERSRYVFGTQSQVRRIAKIKSIKPLDALHASITAALDADEIYTVLSNDIPTGGGYGGRFAEEDDDLVPDDYDLATLPQREANGYFSNDLGRVGQRNDDAYAYQDNDGEDGL